MRKRTAMALALGLVVMSTGAQGVTWYNGIGGGGPGGYIYWTQAFKDGTNQIKRWELYRTTLDNSWDIVTKKDNFDNIASLGSYTGAYADNKATINCEVLDPRDKGGSGDLIMGNVVNFVPGGQTNEHMVWDVIRVDVDCASNNLSFSNTAADHYNLLTTGAIRTSAVTTEKLLLAAAAPQNWNGTTTNGLSFVTYSLGSMKYAAWYDANGDQYCDNTSSESRVMPGPGYYAWDTEIGPDGAIYAAFEPGGSSANGAIQRIQADCTTTRFFTYNGALNPILKAGEHSMGLAVGGTAQSPIVYAVGLDNNASRVGIFALRDGDADGAVDFANANDLIVRIWTDDLYGLSPANNWIPDLELYVNPDNGVQMLLFNGGGGDNLYVLRLADNGLLAVDGAVISATAGSVGRYFEIDMNPIAGQIPEPASLLLLGTGALGVLGYFRRRRMS